jgi:hypothetical protein
MPELPPYSSTSTRSSDRHPEASPDHPFTPPSTPVSRFSFNDIMVRVVQSVKKALLPSKESQSYQSLPNADYGDGDSNSLDVPPSEEGPPKISVFEYGVFMLLGVAM